jgi:phage tail tape-measure protein
MNMLYTIVTVVLAALVYFIKQAGRAAAENEQMKQELNDIEKADDIRAELDHDPAADERVREQFTR